MTFKVLYASLGCYIRIMNVNLSEQIFFWFPIAYHSINTHVLLFVNLQILRIKNVKTEQCVYRSPFSGPETE